MRVGGQNQNFAAWSSFALRPRVLRDVSSVDMSTSVLGAPLDIPVVISSFDGSELCHPDGERALVRAAEAEGSAHLVPHLGSTRFEELRRVAPSTPLFFQLYAPMVPQSESREMDRDYVSSALSLLEREGCRGVFVTVDAINIGNREKTYKSPAWVAALRREVGGFPVARSLDGAGLGAHSGHAIPTWEDINWMVEQTTLPIVAKGIMTEEDALLAARAGCAGVT